MALGNVEPLRPIVACRCGRVVYNGDVIKSRCVKVTLIGARALCKCKEWVPVPVTYQWKNNQSQKTIST